MVDTCEGRWPRVVHAGLRLRPPVPADRGLYDLAAPRWSARRAARRRSFEALLAAWEREGIDHWVVCDDESGGRLGWCGLRVEMGELHLYYWLAPAVRSRGIGTEIARAAVTWAAEYRPHENVVALTRLDNTASIRTAEAAGLLPVPEADTAGSTYGRWEAPRVRRAAPDEGDPDELLDLWEAVVRAGGSVGFRADAPREAIGEALREHLRAQAGGEAVAGHLRSRDGDLLGLAWWRTSSNPLFAHRAELVRLMVDPRHRGRSLGRLLLAGMHGLARELPGVDALVLDYRDGTGLGDFYAGAGYVEVGRWPGLIEAEAGVFRDSVAMMRRLEPRPVHRGERGGDAAGRDH